MYDMRKKERDKDTEKIKRQQKTLGAGKVGTMKGQERETGREREKGDTLAVPRRPTLLL
jgi:hypothetical protein